MHGNMCHSASNCKTRKFDDILKELSSSFRYSLLREFPWAVCTLSSPGTM
jgi:hypothetical protein